MVDILEMRLNENTGEETLEGLSLMLGPFSAGAPFAGTGIRRLSCFCRTRLIRV